MRIGRRDTGRPHDPYAETAWQRGWRKSWATVTSGLFVVWLLLSEAVIAGSGTYLSSAARPWVQGLVTAAVIIGAGVFAFGTVLVTLWVSAPVRQRDEARTELSRWLGKPETIRATFAWNEEAMLVVGVKNEGPTISDAIVHVMVPEGAAPIERVNIDGGEVIGGGLQLHSSTESLAGETGVTYWEEKDLKLSGFGSTTLLLFQVGRAKDGVLPVGFSVGGDEIGGWVGGEGSVIQTATPSTGSSVELQ